MAPINKNHMVRTLKRNFAEEIRSTQHAIKEKMLTLVLGAFGLVAALAWNDAIQSLVNTILPKGQAIIGKFVYAVILTIIVVLISEKLNKLLSEKKE